MTMRLICFCLGVLMARALPAQITRSLWPPDAAVLKMKKIDIAELERAPASR